MAIAEQGNRRSPSEYPVAEVITWSSTMLGRHCLVRVSHVVREMSNGRHYPSVPKPDTVTTRLLFHESAMHHSSGPGPCQASLQSSHYS